MGSYHRAIYDDVSTRVNMTNGSDGQQASLGAAFPPLAGDAFDILDWHPAYESCVRFFLDHAQHESGTQALCALINIRLPFQYSDQPVLSATNVAAQPRRQQRPNQPGFDFTFSSNNGPQSSRNAGGRRDDRSDMHAAAFVSLIPYVRRLVVTGFDKPAILHGFFGDDYARGVLPHVDCERRNYLFAAKHGGWRSCKRQYDAGSGRGGADETVPFMKPLDAARIEELIAAEKAWSDWLCMEDWVLGPRAPSEDGLAGDERLPDGFGQMFDRH